jgi:hypothetical protein
LFIPPSSGSKSLFQIHLRSLLIIDRQKYRAEYLLQKRKVTKGRKCVVTVIGTKADSGHSRIMKKAETGVVAWVVDQTASGLQFELINRICLGKN